MMIQTRNKLSTIVHPLVASMYLKKEYGNPHTQDHNDTLVIETNFPIDDNNSKSFNSYLQELLTDLPTIQNQVEARVGHIDRVDIRPVH
ncbi:MAG: hypothetical protein KGQ41_02720 [Alphaproteobacteria bacterium]|nr:hypothetical protein [Alphaproteobacteria bacterium]